MPNERNWRVGAQVRGHGLAVSVLAGVALASVLAAVVLASSPGRSAGGRPRPAGAVRLLFGGDVMLGRGVASAAASAHVLDGVRSQLAAADLTVANLESPLTSRPHDPAAGPNALEADPRSAGALAAAGFDALAVANNHAQDAGPKTVGDTVAALHAAGIEPLGAGPSPASAAVAHILEIRGIRVALLAFDASGSDAAAEPGETIARWSAAGAEAALRDARARADVVAVGLHGGAEYLPTTDPYLMRLAVRLASRGADVVWCQGPHVTQPVRVIDPDGDGRPTIVATSLGNLLFDQHLPGTERGALLEVTATRDGVTAFRIGTVRTLVPVRFLGWRTPRGDAAALHGEWWTLARRVTPAVPRRPRSLVRFGGGRVLGAALGDPEGTGGEQAVIAFRRPFRRTNLTPLIPREKLVDGRGLTAHVGLYQARDLRQIWVAGTLLRPVAAVAACDGAIAVGYSTLRDPRIVATGAWRWGGFGFLSLPALPGSGRPACADVDGDGRLDPVSIERSSP